MAERAYKRLLRFIAGQSGGAAKLFPAGVGYSRKAIAYCEERGFIETITPRGFDLVTRRITDAGLAEIAEGASPDPEPDNG